MNLGKYAKYKTDPEDLELLNKWSWQTNSQGYLYRTLSSGRRYKGKVYFHRLVINATAGVEVDHINGDVLDNRKSNLRTCSHKQNMGNMRMHKDNTSGFKGVSFQKGKWVARVGNLYLGRYVTAEKAAEVYNQKAVDIFGSFAKLN